MPHNPASIVRLLYGERAQKRKTAPKRFLSTPASNSLTSARHIGQGHRSRTPEMVSVLRSPSPDLAVDLVPREVVAQSITSCFADQQGTTPFVDTSAFPGYRSGETPASSQ